MEKRSIKPSSRTRTIGIIAVMGIILAVGLVLVYDASIADGTRLFGNRYFFALRHGAWIGIGLLLLWVVSRVPTPLLKVASFPLFVVSLMLLIVVLLPSIGTSAKGAQRWIRISDFFSIQPSEIAKLSTVLYLSVLLEKSVRSTTFFMLVGLEFFLLLLQPDLGTAVIIAAIAFSLYFVSGAPLRVLAGWGVIGGLIVGFAIWESPYRRTRLLTFLDPSRDTLGASYHLNQSIIALGSGGVFGLGLGRSRQKFQYLPEAATDSIFAVLGEEFGFIGTMIILGLFSVLFFQLIRLALREHDVWRRFVIVGIFSWLVSQAVLNVGSTTGILPYTGVPLPFMSYGGSSLVTQLVALGIISRMSLTTR